jgi:predicted acetyltransferase
MVILVEATEAQKPILAQLIELYEHDMSAFTGDDVGPDGKYGYRYLNLYWTRKNRYPYFLYTDKQLCGFALIRLDVPSALKPGKTAHNIAEFFVMKKYRGMGIGKQAAIKAFSLFPGSWEVFQIANHNEALKFWRKVISAYTHGEFQEAFLNNSEWHGTVQGLNNAHK